MPRYREHERTQSIMVPIQFEEQIQPGTFEHAIDYLVDNEIDLSEFEAVYQNDDTGAPAIHPGILVENRTVLLLPGYRQQPSHRQGVRGERIVHGLKLRHSTSLYHDCQLH